MKTKLSYFLFGTFANLTKIGFSFLLGFAWKVFDYNDVGYLYLFFVIFVNLTTNRLFKNFWPTHPLIKVVIPSIVFFVGLSLSIMDSIVVDLSRFLDNFTSIYESVFTHPFLRPLLFDSLVVPQLIEICVFCGRTIIFVFTSFSVHLLTSCF